MTSFRTELKPVPSSQNISHQDQILAMGSCFAENMGQKLSEHKFRVQLNPFGIVYNPISLAKGLQRLLEPLPYREEDLVQNAGLWHSFDHHGAFSHPDKNEVLDQINYRIGEVSASLIMANVLMLTLGTASVFEYLENGKVVANCHKFPGKAFKRYRLGVDAVYLALEGVLEKLFHQNPEIRVILTASPVRHLRDGLHENQLSKATLLLATEQVCQKFEQVEYYPAYELQLDDLRDYRFYAEDHAHPNSQAVDYIWSHFAATYFDETTHQLNREIAKVMRAVQHRPFHIESAEHQEFLRKQLAEIEDLESRHPGMDFSRERQFLSSQSS